MSFVISTRDIHFVRQELAFVGYIVNKLWTYLSIITIKNGKSVVGEATGGGNVLFRNFDNDDS